MLKQLLCISELSLLSLRHRVGSVLVTIVVVAGMAGVLVAALALREGRRRTFSDGARDDRIVIVSKGAANEVDSVILMAKRPIIADAPGIKRDPERNPIMSTDY